MILINQIITDIRIESVNQLQRTSKREYVIEPTKTNAGTRVIPMTNEVTEMFRAIIEDRPDYKVEKSGRWLHGIPFSGQGWNATCSHALETQIQSYGQQVQ